MIDRNSDTNFTGTRRTVDRRRKTDWVVRSVSIVSLLGWISAAIAFFLLGWSKPNTELFPTQFGTWSASDWNTNMLRVAFVSILISFVVCVAGFFANMARHRRKSDRFNKSIIILGVLSLIGTVIFLMNYTYLFP